MKRILLFFTFLPSLSFAQLTIERCQELARNHYPLIQRYGIIEKTTAYNISNASKGYLPQFMLSAKASYQSDVTALPAQISGIQIAGLPKDQYMVALDISQSIWDGGAIERQKGVIKAGEAVEQAQVGVDLYALEKRVNQLFFGILLWEAQLEQNRLLRVELQRHYIMVDACIESGMANLTDLDAVVVEQLRAQQLYHHLLSGKRAYREMLSVMIGQTVDESVTLEKPDPDALFVSNQINRPELKLFDAQNQLFEIQKSALTASYMPRLNLFVQGGYGRPGLNMLDNHFSPFYVGGIRFTWNFGALYTQKNDRFKLDLAQLNTETMRETFLYQTNLEVTQQNIQLERIKKMVQYHNDIIALREKIRRSAEAKVANGTLTVTELMREVTSENMAKQEKMVHEIELLMAIYDLKYTTNN